MSASQRGTVRTARNDPGEITIRAAAFVICGCILCCRAAESSTMAGAFTLLTALVYIGASILGLVAVICTGAAFVYKQVGEKVPDKRTYLLVIPILFLLVSAIAVRPYFIGMLNPWGLATYHQLTRYHFVLSSLSITIIVAWLFYYLDKRATRVAILCVVGVVFIAETFLTPGVIGYKYYDFVDNEPIAEPVEILTSRDEEVIHLADGRVIRLDKAFRILGKGSRVGLEQISPERQSGRFRFVIKQGDHGAGGVLEHPIIHIPITRVVVNKYVAREIGGGTLLPSDWEADGGMLFRATARRIDDTEWIRELLKRGADPNHVFEPLGTTPLHYAAQRGSVEVTDMLIEAGARTDVRDKQGRTPLHTAAMNSLSAVKSLLNHGADADALDNEDRIPLALAEWYLKKGYGRARELRQIIAFLKKRDADPEGR